MWVDLVPSLNKDLQSTYQSIYLSIYTSQKAALGRQEFYAKLYEILC